MWFTTLVYQSVSTQTRARGEEFVAHGTLIWLIVSVSSFMRDSVVFFHECFTADTTYKRFLTGVRPNVRF